MQSIIPWYFAKHCIFKLKQQKHITITDSTAYLTIMGKLGGVHFDVSYNKLLIYSHVLL